MIIEFNTHGNLKQKEVCKLWVDSTTTDIAYGGSKGSGKSYLGVSLIFGDAFLYPGTNYFIARKSLTNIRKFTIPSIHEVFAHWNIRADQWKYNGQDNYYELHNGSRVYLLDAKYLPSDPEYYRFGSMQMTRGWIEEAGEFEEAAKNNLSASLGRWKNNEYKLTAKLLQTCNPSKNYLYREYYIPNKAGTLPEWRKFVQALPQDNKMLSDGYLDNLERNLTPNERERLLQGNWEVDTDASALIDYNKIIDTFSNNHVIEGRKCITADMARLGGDKIVIVEWNGFRGHIRFYQKQDLATTTQMLEAARSRLGCGKSDILIDEDGLGGGVVDFYGCKGFVNNARALPSPSNPQKDIKGNIKPENFDNQKSQCYYKLAERVNNNGIYITYDDDRVREWVIQELEQVKQKRLDSDLKKGIISKDHVKELIGRSPDFSDALMMREAFEMMPRFVPTPQDDY
ncbi:Terminase-like family [uncultured Caudovirales phage]|uniref:Terminase-like family n=1 Tax=uncultured Caudovirales phage TaxID=2100421 RepID=A0A6J5KNW2_9CAUD|nr:Terminase-like family [uncultured Caudovirales phage]